jgi:thymidine phosphorylase
VFLPQETIRAKRDGKPLDASEIAAFIDGIANGRVTEGQAAAFAMAVLLKGMNTPERVALTEAMTRSGEMLRWDLPGPVLDKHSTGGIGDKVSLILAPLVASCGGYVPMVAGRGLGHTGGTIDKLEAIPGYVTRPDSSLFRHVVNGVGCAIVGATEAIAPADRRLYGIRDTTATVESIDLIVASILSKKRAAGLDALVMDVKTGSGAFMATLEDSRALARALVDVANGSGLPTIALLTDMNECLGTSAGNAVEVRESIDFLCGEPVDARLREVTFALAAELLVVGRLAPDVPAALRALEAALDSGQAAERFQRMVTELGGPTDLLEKPDRHLPAAPVIVDVPATTGGYVASIDVRTLGLAIVQLGGGRARPMDLIDPSVGLTEVAPLGGKVGPGAAPLARVHARSQDEADAAIATLQNAVRISDTAPAANRLIVERVA